MFEGRKCAGVCQSRTLKLITEVLDPPYVEFATQILSRYTLDIVCLIDDQVFILAKDSVLGGQVRKKKRVIDDYYVGL
tara:strand:+ start:209 stop:442 length:234 start_codon:yes stop_codon:yes gene_type:complete